MIITYEYLSKMIKSGKLKYELQLYTKQFASTLNELIKCDIDDTLQEVHSAKFKNMSCEDIFSYYLKQSYLKAFIYMSINSGEITSSENVDKMIINKLKCSWMTDIRTIAIKNNIQFIDHTKRLDELIPQYKNGARYKIEINSESIPGDIQNYTDGDLFNLLNSIKNNSEKISFTISNIDWKKYSGNHNDELYPVTMELEKINDKYYIVTIHNIYGEHKYTYKIPDEFIIRDEIV